MEGIVTSGRFKRHSGIYSVWVRIILQMLSLRALTSIWRIPGAERRGQELASLSRRSEP